jgi:hypothetical protein
MPEVSWLNVWHACTPLPGPGPPPWAHWHALAGLSASTECETCIFTTHVLDDLLCDPWLDDQVC